MEFDHTPKDGILVWTVSRETTGGSDTPPTDAATMLKTPTIKGLVVITGETVHQLPGTAIDDVVRLLTITPVPKVAVTAPEDSPVQKRIAGICDIFCETREDAVRQLRQLVKGRSPEVVRAVMTALNAERSLPPEAAFREESRLFCELAKRKRSTRRSSRG